MSKGNGDEFKSFPFSQEPVSKVTFTAKELITAFIDSLNGSRGPLVEIEASFYEAEYFNAWLFHGRKLVSKVARTGPVATNLLHLVMGELVRHKVSRVVFGAYDAPGHECNELRKGKIDDE